MLTKLIIENYKSIERAELYFSKINLLIGPNGSGKSSVLESAEIMGFKRNYIPPISSTLINSSVIIERFKGIKFFDSLIYTHSTNKKILISGKFENSIISTIEVRLALEQGERKITTQASLGSSVDVEISRILHILKANRRIERRLHGVTGNTYNINTTNAHQLFYYACYRTEFKENIQMIREFYSRYGLHDVRWVPTERQNEYEIIATTPEGVDVNLADAGAGLAALFPIVVALSFYPEGSTVFIEHPEMHLHPKLQYELAEFFLTVSEKRNYQLIIETHSEHLLYGLLNAVAQKRLKPDELTVYSTKKENGKSVFEKMIVHEDGSLEGNLSDFLEADIDAFLDWLKA